MSWLQLRLDTAAGAVGDLEDALLALGAVAVTLEDNADQPVLEPRVGETPLWRQTRLTGLFPADAEIKRVIDQLPPDLVERGKPRVEILEDKDWEREWMQHYQPMQFGERLWVCPSWLPPPDPTAINLMLDPGLAFGTGTHPTTALCLAELAASIGVGEWIVDYGCGSGILAVAALKLGATRALCVDNDPQALAATLDNAGRNGIAAASIEIAAPDGVDRALWSGRADTVVANILAGPLLELSPTLLALLRPGGNLLLSGLLETQADRVCDHYRDQVELQVAASREGWVCLQGRLPRTS